MPGMPRIAVGSLHDDAHHRAVLWGLLDLLANRELHVQTFLAESRFVPWDGATAITGQRYRHLDSWLMNAEQSRCAFLRGARGADVAVVEGTFAQASHSKEVVAQAGAPVSSLEQLSAWLGLFRLGIVNASQADLCRLPDRPAHVDAILLDRVPEPAEWIRLKTRLEMHWRVPVLGAMPAVEGLRQQIARLLPGERPSRALCRSLGMALAPSLDLDKLLRRASAGPGPSPHRCYDHRQAELASLNIAVALDDAFQCYFPDALDMLEASGATVRDFSPLRDEALPAETDLVYIGCGHAERFAEQLARNCCMLHAIRRHALAGRRCYAEGAGLAYLSRQMQLRSGRSYPMAGLLPTIAVDNPHPVPVQPCEIQPSQACWLADNQTPLRGYRNDNWRLLPAGDCVVGYHGVANPDFLGDEHVVGSRLHLNFATQPALLDRFFHPYPSVNAPSHAS